MEMRFYIPGTVTKKEKDADGEEKSGGEEEEVEEQNAANLFYETLMDKAEIGEVAGDTFATFLDVLHLTPRYIGLAGGSSVVTNVELTVAAGADSMSTCTKIHSVSEAKHTTTRSSMNTSRNSCSFQNRMTFIL